MSIPSFPFCMKIFHENCHYHEYGDKGWKLKTVGFDGLSIPVDGAWEGIERPKYHMTWR